MKMNEIDHKKKLSQYIIPLIQKETQLILGSGTTVNAFIEELSNHTLSKSIQVISASNATSEKLKSCDIDEIPINQFHWDPAVQLICIDSVDQIILTDNLPIILKGHGSALVREKILWQYANKKFILLDEGKITSDFSKSIPIEIVPFGLDFIKKQLLTLDIPGIKVTLRHQDDTPLISDNNNYIIDLEYQVPLMHPELIDQSIKTIAGVVETGLFYGSYVGNSILFISKKTEIKEIKID